MLFKNPPNNWKTRTLGEICIEGGGGIQTGPFGSQLHASDYVDEGIPSIMPVNIVNNRISEYEITRITKSDASRLSKYLVEDGDIVYSRRGDVEKCALITTKENGWLCGTGCLRVRPGKGVIDSGFCSYFLSHPESREWISRHAVGATMPNLNTSILSQVPCLLPPQKEQKAITNILRTFDEKIELNKKTNETLESIAKAFFKSWFIDFDPVRAKAEGRSTGLPDEIYDLFPDSFEVSELGQIPKGWEIKKISQIISRLPVGKKFSNKTVNGRGNIPVIDQSKYGIIGFHNEEPGITASMDHPLFTFANHTCAMRIMMHPFSVIQNVFPLEGNRVSNLWLYLALLGKQKFTEYKGHYPDLIEKQIVVPSRHIDKHFHEIVLDLYRKNFIKEEESLVLIQLRDVLLPKLISGEIRIPDAEKMIEKVAI